MATTRVEIDLSDFDAIAKLQQQLADAKRKIDGQSAKVAEMVGQLALADPKDCQDRLNYHLDGVGFQVVYVGKYRAEVDTAIMDRINSAPADTGAKLTTKELEQIATETNCDVRDVRRTLKMLRTATPAKIVPVGEGKGRKSHYTLPKITDASAPAEPRFSENDGAWCEDEEEGEE